jgi:hypothetical protein
VAVGMVQEDLNLTRITILHAGSQRAVILTQFPAAGINMVEQVVTAGSSDHLPINITGEALRTLVPVGYNTFTVDKIHTIVEVIDDILVKVVSLIHRGHL